MLDNAIPAAAITSLRETDAIFGPLGEMLTRIEDVRSLDDASKALRLISASPIVSFFEYQFRTSGNLSAGPDWRFHRAHSYQNPPHVSAETAFRRMTPILWRSERSQGAYVTFRGDRQSNSLLSVAFAIEFLDTPPDLAAQAQRLLFVIAHLHARIAPFFTKDRIALDANELRCLSLLYRGGFRVADLPRLLDKDRSAINRYLATARLKLKQKNTLQAVIQAALMGLLDGAEVLPAEDHST